MKLIIVLVALISGCTSTSHNQQPNTGIGSGGTYTFRFDNQRISRTYLDDVRGVDQSGLVGGSGVNQEQAGFLSSADVGAQPLIGGQIGGQQPSVGQIVLQTAGGQQVGVVDAAEGQPQLYASKDVSSLHQQKSQLDEDSDDVLDKKSDQSSQSAVKSKSSPPAVVEQQKELIGQRKLVVQQAAADLSNRKVPQQQQDSQVRSDIGGSVHQQVIHQSVPQIVQVVRDQSSVIPQQVIPVVQQQSYPFVYYSHLGPVMQQREYYVPSQSSQIDNEDKRSDISQQDSLLSQSPIGRQPSMASAPAIKVKQQAELSSESDGIFPQVLTGQRRLTEPVVEEPKRQVSAGSLVSSGVDVGGAGYQQIIYSDVPVVQPAVQQQQSVQQRLHVIPQRVQVLQQGLPFVSYSRLGPIGQQREQHVVQVPSVSSLVNVPNSQSQLVNQMVREVKHNVQPVLQNVRYQQQLPSNLLAQRQYIHTLVQPSVYQWVYQPKSSPFQMTTLRQLLNPYNLHEPLLGSSHIIVQPLQYSGVQDMSVRGVDNVVGGDINARVDEQIEPRPALYGTKSVSAVNV